jgi:hypothetical protein
VTNRRQGVELVKFQKGDSPLKPCGSTQVLVRLSSALTAGTGPTVENGSTLQLDPRYALPQNCQTGDRVTWNGSGWACGDTGGPLP